MSKLVVLSEKTIAAALRSRLLNTSTSSSVLGDAEQAATFILIYDSKPGRTADAKAYLFEDGSVLVILPVGRHDDSKSYNTYEEFRQSIYSHISCTMMEHFDAFSLENME
jgi:hypothetical protein